LQLFAVGASPQYLLGTKPLMTPPVRQLWLIVIPWYLNGMLTLLQAVFFATCAFDAVLAHDLLG